MLQSKLRVVVGRDTSGWRVLLICFLVATGLLSSHAGNATGTRKISYSDIAHAYHGLLLNRDLKEIKLNKAVIERIQDSIVESLTAVPEIDENETADNGMRLTIQGNTGGISASGGGGAGPTAPQSAIKLFNANPTFNTGPQTSAPEAIPFASTSVILSFAPGDTAFISSTPDGTGPIVIDNFLTISGVNTCEGVPGQIPGQALDSCFGPIINPSLPTGMPIQTVLTPIPPIDVSKFMPVGTEEPVLFELRDFGVIAGNSELFLVTTGQRISMPPLDKAYVEDVLTGFKFSADERILTKSALIQKGIDFAPVDEKLAYQSRFDLIHQGSLNFISSDFGIYRPKFKKYLISVDLEEIIRRILERPKPTSPYIADCRTNKVPIPPPWPTGGWNKRGPLPAQFIFASTDKAAEVWTYEVEQEGLCYALPRTKGNVIELLGIICQSKRTGKACFWDNIDATTRERITGVEITLPIDKIQGGDALSENCTTCHRGDNAFIIIPPNDTHLGDPPRSLRDPDMRYTPIGQATWSNPPAFSTKGSGACSGCHEIAALNPNICQFLRQAADKTMPSTATPAGWTSPSEAYSAHIRSMKDAMCPE